MQRVNFWMENKALRRSASKLQGHWWSLIIFLAVLVLYNYRSCCDLWMQHKEFCLLGTLEVLQFGLLLVVQLLLPKSDLGQPWLCLSAVLTSKDRSSAAFLCSLFNVALPSWRRRLFPVSAVGQYILDPLPSFPKAHTFIGKQNERFLRRYSFLWYHLTFLTLLEKLVKGETDYLKLWWHLNWTSRKGVQKSSLQVMLFCLHFWEWKNKT